MALRQHADFETFDRKWEHLSSFYAPRRSAARRQQRIDRQHDEGDAQHRQHHC
jgi:hypothetical protein